MFIHFIDLNNILAIVGDLKQIKSVCVLKAFYDVFTANSSAASILLLLKLHFVELWLLTVIVLISISNKWWAINDRSILKWWLTIWSIDWFSQSVLCSAVTHQMCSFYFCCRLICNKFAFNCLCSIIHLINSNELKWKSIQWLLKWYKIWWTAFMIIKHLLMFMTNKLKFCFIMLSVYPSIRLSDNFDELIDSLSLSLHFFINYLPTFDWECIVVVA